MQFVTACLTMANACRNQQKKQQRKEAKMSVFTEYVKANYGRLSQQAVARESVSREISLCGILTYFKVKPIKDVPGILGIARDRDTKGCLTFRIVDGNVAVYPEMSIRDVAASLRDGDGVAAANAIYKQTFSAAEARLRRFQQ